VKEETMPIVTRWEPFRLPKQEKVKPKRIAVKAG
jgi:hypothetical protein